MARFVRESFQHSRLTPLMTFFARRSHIGEAVLDQITRMLALACERIGVVRTLVGMFHFRGKERTLAYIRPDHLPREVIATRRGITYKLDLAESIQRSIYFDAYEREDLVTVVNHVSRGGVCIDVGANIGFYTLHLAKCVGKDGVVHSFEPDPDNFSRLIENVRLNDLTLRVHAHKLAVGNETGPIAFYRSDPSHSGWGSLAEFNDIAVGKIGVDAITLDHFLSSRSIASVDLLKVDVEAWEFELLKGAVRSLHAQVFKYIFIEFNGIRLAERNKSLMDFMEIFAVNGYHPILRHLDRLEQMKKGKIKPETQLMNLLFEADRSQSLCG